MIKEDSKSKILLPKIDVIFKLLFGDTRNSDILIDFLQSVLNLPENEYEVITIIDPHLKRETIGDKLGIVDVRLKTKNNKMINIEIQIVEQNDMPERAVYYNAKSLVTQLKAGEGYHILEKTITIVIADFEIVKNSHKYHHLFQLYDKPTGVRFTDIMEINTLELKKIPEKSDNTRKYEWMKFLKSEKEEEFQMLAEKNPIIEKAFVELKRLSQDEETQMLYEAREKAIRDENSRLRSALNKGRAEGRAEGKVEVAKRLLELGFAVIQVSEGTGLSVEEIRALNEDL